MMASRTDWLLALPVLLPLGACALATALHGRIAAQRLVSLAASALLLLGAIALVAEVVARGVIATQAGDWPAPFGITLVADRLGAAMVLITALMYAAVAVFARAEPDMAGQEAYWHPLLAALVAGVAGSFLAGDLFNLYVWFEVMLIASFGLLVLGGGREQLDAALKYAVLNLTATTVFLVAIAMAYGLTGTLNLADMARKMPAVENQGAAGAVAFLLLAAFGAKAAVFPLFFWLPAAYHTAIAPVAAIFAALLTKVGVYAMLRIVTLVFPEGQGWIGPVLWVVAAGTMVVGVLGAAAHWEIRRILSFHIISQIGYMIVGIAIATPFALAGAVLYILHHIVVKANLFLVAGAIRRAGGSFSLAQLGALWRRDPWLGILFAIPALSLAGLPPLSGFWAKLFVVKSGFDAGWYWLSAIALGTGILTLYSMVKIWMEAFWKEPPEGTPEFLLSGPERLLMLLPIAALGLVTLTIGLWTEPFAAFALEAGNELAGREAYIAAVLGGAR
ncbi:multicomponent Na+:H+ antiporter subunit D [Roseomonas alkaliterrae]|uniref:Multicomponent Na+:H+ antiporter subunit D n=1 Tax=Neoroseomonas alkaliterrae TaxID=1452450 RepID=A0A840XV78_9PROT|nr:proton-conducting transporter membrane subunit [Neoroseomonas alkaliterrae]MBB5688047.1 multicomponent Na+:H+ antiporter subunit D [Neoroseomonas alkaliterrae]